jgi:hypothetical protein
MAEVNTYRNFSIASSEKYPLISNFSFMLKPEVNGVLFDINPMETDLGDMMKAGLMKEVFGEDEPGIVHHEANEIFDTPFVNTSTTQGLVYGTASEVNGDPAAMAGKAYIQLATESHSPATGAQAGYYSYPRVGQSIQFKNGGAWRITGKRDGAAYANAHRLYLDKINSSTPDLSATITLVGTSYGGDLFILPGSIWEEGTAGQQTGVVPTTKVYNSYLQTFYEKYEITDWQKRNKTYPMLWHGKMVNFVYPRGFEQTEIRFAASEEYGLFLTPRGTDIPGFDENGNAILMSTTQGYIPNLETNAPKLYYDSNPTVNLFRQIARLRRKLLQGPRMVLKYGAEFGINIEDILNQFATDGGQIYNRKALDLGFQTVKTAGMEIYCKEMKNLNHPKFAGAAGFPYPYYFIVEPYDKISDPKGGIPRNAFEIIYKKLMGKGNRDHYKMWTFGGLSEAGTDGRLKEYISIASRKGARVVGASKFILGKPAYLA